MVKIFNEFDGFNYENIVSKNIWKISNNLIKIELKYQKKKKMIDFLFQTPKMYMPFGIKKNLYSNSYNLELSFRDKEYNYDINKFYEFIHKINSRIKKVFLDNDQIKNLRKGKKCKYINCIKKDDYGGRIKTKINFIDVNNIIYNENKNNVNLDRVGEKTFCKSIIKLDYIWIRLNEKKKLEFGLTFSAMQIKLYSRLILEEYSFIDENVHHKKTETIIVSEECKIKNDSRFSNYFKMLKFGVPRENIYQKMDLNNHDRRILDCDPEKRIPKELNLTMKNDIKVNLDSQIIGGINLKTVENIKKIKKKKKYKKVGPSLEDILKTINSLRKTKFKHKYVDDI